MDPTRAETLEETAKIIQEKWSITAIISLKLAMTMVILKSQIFRSLWQHSAIRACVQWATIL